MKPWFKEKLGVISIKELTKTAKERKAGSIGFAEAMLLFYNKRLKNPLVWNVLYENRIDRKKAKKKEAENNEEVGLPVNVDEEWIPKKRP